MPPKACVCSKITAELLMYVGIAFIYLFTLQLGSNTEVTEVLKTI